MTRAFGRLLAGDLPGALAYHPLSLVVVALGAGVLIWFAGKRWWKWPAPSARFWQGGLASVGVVFLGVWILRFSSGSLPSV